MDTVLITQTSTGIHVEKQQQKKDGWLFSVGQTENTKIFFCFSMEELYESAPALAPEWLFLPDESI